MWNTPLETLSRDELGASQIPLLAQQIKHVCTHGKFYSSRFEGADVKPADITDIEALIASTE